MAEMKLLGMAGVTAKLNALGDPKFAKTARNTALIKAGRVLKAAIEDNAPVAALGPTADGTSLEPGELKANIGMSLIEDGPNGAYVSVGPNRNVAHIARWVEYGHRLVKGGSSKLNKRGGYSGKGTQIGFVPAYPFIRPAGEVAGPEAVAVFKDEFAQQVNAAWSGRKVDNAE